MVNLEKIVTISFKTPKEGKIKVCVSNRKPEISRDITYISPQAPLAQAILNHFEGEEVEFLSPSGPLRIKIMRVF